MAIERSLFEKQILIFSQLVLVNLFENITSYKTGEACKSGTY